MNYQKSKLALALASATLLVACGGGGGGGGGGGSAPTASLSGVAANGLLANAKVCVDSNDNLQCDAGEPSTTTNANGEYSLTGLKNTDVQGKNLIVEVGSATAGNSTGKSNIFLRKLKTPIAANEVLTAQSINPFTTLLGGSDITLAELAAAFGLTESQLGQADYSGDAAVSSIANMLAGKIAGELEATVTSSAVNKGGVLLGVNGLLQDVAAMLKTKSNLTSAELEAALAEITVDKPALNEVVDASLALTVNNRNDIALSQVAILVTAYQADTNTPIESIANNELVIGETDVNGGALINLPAYAQASIDIDVELKKEGFVTVVKRIKGVQAGDRIPLTLAMTEEALSSKKTTTSFDLPSATAASFDTGEPAFTLALVSLPSGEKVLLAGESAAQAMADGESDVQVGVQIPVNRIDTDNVTAITAGVQGFDPSKPGDAQSFPGNFEGVGHDQGYPEDGVNSEFLGGASASADGEEPEVVPIISTSFAQIRLEDQDGNEFEMVSAEAGAAADSTPVIYLRVPESTYTTVTKDMNDDVTGVQVPVYVYRSGQGWVLIGLATLVKWDNGNYVAYADGLPLQTGSGQLYAKVEITQGNEWIRWVNLDWPVVAGNDIVSCKFSGNVRWQGEKSERYDGSGYIEFSDGARQYLYSYGGSFDYNGLTTQARAADAKLFLYNQYTYQYEEFTFTDKTPADGSDCDFVLNPNPALLTNPFQCEVQGRMVKKGLPVSWQWVYLSGERFYRYVYTNAAGEYSSVAPCDADVKLAGGWYDYNQGKYGIERTLRINSQVASDESQDDNVLVRMNDIEMPNQPPSVWAWANTWRISIPNGQSANVDLMAYGYDYDSDSLTYEWTCPGSAVAAWVYSNSSKSCSIPSSAVTVDSGQNVPWSVKVTDTEGASSTYNGSVYAEVKGRNKAPRITGILRDNRNLNCTRTVTQELECVDNIAEASTPEYKVVAVDADGDTLTYAATAPLSGVAGSENDGRFQINGVSLGSNISTVTVTDVRSGDDARSSNAVLTVTGIENKAPVVYVGLNRNRYTKGVHTNAVVSASLWDDNANYESLRNSAELVVKDKDGNPVSPALAIEQEGNRWNVDIASLAVGQYQLVIQVTDGAKSTQASTAFNVVNSMAPQLTLTAPGNLAINQLNRLVNPSAQFVARVWDDGGMDGLDVSVELVKGDASWALDYEVDGYVITGDFQNIAEETLEAGTYTLRVKVKDADNDEVKRESSISIELPNNSAEIIIQ